MTSSATSSRVEKLNGHCIVVHNTDSADMESNDMLSICSVCSDFHVEWQSVSLNPTNGELLVIVIVLYCHASVSCDETAKYHAF